MSYVVKTTDPIVIEIIKKIDQRSLTGQEKYGDTMMSEVNSGKKDLHRFMVDVQEEMTDMLLYMESARHCLDIEVEKVRQARMDIIAQNGNDGLHYENIEVVDEEVL